MAIKTTMTAMTTNISTNVNPRFRGQFVMPTPSVTSGP
jgi:hypothetical protein